MITDHILINFIRPVVSGVSETGIFLLDLSIHAGFWDFFFLVWFYKIKKKLLRTLGGERGVVNKAPDLLL